MFKPLIIGESPGPNYAAEKSTGGRLADLMGLSVVDYLKRTKRLNLLPHHRSGWSASAIQSAAMNLLRGGMLDDEVVILLGRRVATAFAIGPEVPWCEWFVLRNRMALLPRPSSRNKWYNDPVNEELARKFLTKAVEPW